MDGWQALADADGLLRAADAVRAGLDAKQLARLARGGDLTGLAQGWYLVTSAVPAPLDDSPWERRRNVHVAQTRAVLRVYEGRVVASHHSALVLNALPTFAADLRQVHVSRVAGTHSRRRPGLTIHRALPGTSSTDGVIDVGDAIMGTVAVNGELAALVAADAACHRRLVTVAELPLAADRVVDRHARAALRVAASADARAESPGETRLRHALRLMGYAVTPQFAIRDGSFVAVVDLMLDDEGVAFEFDGFVKYGRRDRFALYATPADVVAAEKVREDHIRELGYGMGRVVWPELDDLVLLRRKVVRAIESVRRRSA
jgi:hypothetical protein